MSQISPLMFFLSEKEVFSRTYLLKKTPPRTKILISPIWNKILKIWDTLFELIQIEVQCSKNSLKMFLLQEAGEFRNKIEKKTQKPRPKLEKNVCYIFTDNTCSVCIPMQVIIFLQKCINFIEHRLKFSYFKGSIIP